MISREKGERRKGCNGRKERIAVYAFLRSVMGFLAEKNVGSKNALSCKLGKIVWKPETT